MFESSFIDDLYQFSITFLPNGINDISSNLRCCLAKGIPMIVMASNTAQKRWFNAVYIPPQKIQIILANRLRHPDALAVLTTLFPKGNNMRAANLKHWIPKGIPIIVMHSTSPPMK